MVQIDDDILSTIADHDEEGSLLLLEAIAEERGNARVAVSRLVFGNPAEIITLGD